MAISDRSINHNVGVLKGLTPTRKAFKILRELPKLHHLIFPTAYVPVGCFRQPYPPMLLTLIKSLRDVNFDWYNLQLTVEACAKLIGQSKVFGISFYGECWAGSDAEHTYKKMEKSTSCTHGVGQKLAYFIYELNRSIVGLVFL